MNNRKIKRYLKEAAFLAALFLIAVIAFSLYTNRGNDNMAADMDGATYPQLAFSSNGYTVNRVPGFAQEMDMASLRDTITPVTNGQVEIEIEPYDNEIASMKCRLYSLDGKEKLLETETESPGTEETVSIGDPSLTAEERILQVVLELSGGKSVYYYTRVIDSQGKNVQQCLDYVKGFHENAFVKAEGVGIGTAIEPDETGDNTTYQHVTIHSDYDHVTWGELSPAVEGEEIWQIKEINNISVSVQIQYQVRCRGEENEEDLYKVKEFFRVRYRADTKKMLLLDYDRKMEQVFDTSKKILSEKGILLGIADSGLSYMVNKDGTQAAFVQADELWHYNKTEDEMALVFSFASTENKDERNRTAQHKIELLEMDKKGNLSFAVYGYMNRGEHEGETGAAVYYYNAEENCVEEKVFISTNRSSGHVMMELGKLVYYSVNTDMLYVLANRTLYEINVEKSRVRELADDLEEGQYVVSEDGRRIAYQSGKRDRKASQVRVIEMSSGKKRTVECEEEGISIVPLGFMDRDFVYGLSRAEDAGVTLAGENVAPMYRVEIQDPKENIVKDYESEGTYIISTEFDGNMITLNRVVKKGDVYHSVIEEYITNNEEEKENNITLSSYTTTLKQRQLRLTFGDGIADKEPKLLKPKQTLYEKPKVFSVDEEPKKECYLVYGYGELRGIFDKAGEAVRQADEYNGVVVSETQEYVWERGNRDLRYSITEKNAYIEGIRVKLRAGTPPVEALGGTDGGSVLDLTGCTPEQLMYIINQDKPVIAMVNASKALILVGYTENRIIYIDADSGERKTVRPEKVEEMTEKSRHTYIAPKS
jgi:hypothetical protein